jgi:hypothetical protein
MHSDGGLRRLIAQASRERWPALGMAALVAAAVGVLAALTMGGAIGSSSSTVYTTMTGSALGTGRPIATQPTKKTGKAAGEAPSVLDLVHDPGLQGLAARAFDRIVMGKISFNHPTSMRIGDATRIQARIAKTPTKELTEGFAGPGPIKLEGIAVSTLVRVTLLGDAFHIEALSTADQPVLSTGYTQWEWSVTPRRTGMQSLYLRVTLRLQIPNHGTEFLDRVVYSEPIRVAVNPIYAVTQFTGDNWQWMLGTTAPVAALAGLVRGYIRRRRRPESHVEAGPATGTAVGPNNSADPPGDGNSALENLVNRQEDLTLERGMAALAEQELEEIDPSLQHGPKIAPIHEDHDRPDG